MKDTDETKELQEQIAYIEEWVVKCRKACEPRKNEKERGEWLGCDLLPCPKGQGFQRQTVMSLLSRV